MGLARALEIFDALPAVAVEELSGRWAGTEVPTGSPLDGLLGAYGWYGKRFASAEEVDPLVFSRNGTLLAVNPTLLPIGLAVRFPRLARNPVLATVARQVLPLLRTLRPKARLRMVDYRGVLTATMTYDARPINDHFRRLDGDTLLGVMDLRGLAEPFFFLLRREAPAT